MHPSIIHLATVYAVTDVVGSDLCSIHAYTTTSPDTGAAR